ncbi:hypothetical protein PHYSODRAFT_336019 [Phytophthora sojae]|uniref:Uncharacterized protein n=1 Tax=Phytophthora sojae (strain P6497) TaxID=1094619 RepID=G4ZVH2_PHYSP|nr:hypothetical protein PHYSODRAFT_336019 [Phytophthora sojae]EGZ11490.1 hypothetical protein PHYSODRAFT_336019 [Phytophthora sojae]|eukprot:XP_009531823.1 hypothetical protein PHYSODRAFT_336019 [Phytophthora sojae]
MATAKTTTAKTTTAKKTVVTTSTATTTTGKMTTAKTKRQHVQPTSTNTPKRVRYSSRVTDEPMPTQPVQHDTQLQTRFAEMERARNNYYTNAVVLARIKDKPKTVEDAFSAVALRLDDVLAVLMGTAQFEPDPDALYKFCVERGADVPGEIVIGNPLVLHEQAFQRALGDLQSWELRMYCSSASFFG